MKTFILLFRGEFLIIVLMRKGKDSTCFLILWSNRLCAHFAWRVLETSTLCYSMFPCRRINSISELQNNKGFVVMLISLLSGVFRLNCFLRSRIRVCPEMLSRKNFRRLFRCVKIEKDGFVTTVEVNTNKSTFQSSTCESI